ncbi:putative leader peptide [Streptomyces leeuwenhoekii]|uniref:putative leader peptide n=1 Tax=Streptomyces leeuwenhoekii TaxID=1437453 RepID=UPI0034D2402C
MPGAQARWRARAGRGRSHGGDCRGVATVWRRRRAAAVGGCRVASTVRRGRRRSRGTAGVRGTATVRRCLGRGGGPGHSHGTASARGQHDATVPGAWRGPKAQPRFGARGAATIRRGSGAQPRRDGARGTAAVRRAPGALPRRHLAVVVPACGEGGLTGPQRRGVLRIMTGTCVRLWRRVHMDLVRYAGCVCRPSC